MFWRSTIGKKAVMAVTGAVMLLYLLAHMLGNLKIFFGRESFDEYAHWLRSIGVPALHEAWFLWVMRALLLGAVVLHAASAYQLSRRDLRARPQKYSHRQRLEASYAVNTMRYGGIIIGLFIIYHLLDFTALTLNRNGVEGAAYDNVVSSFSVWWVTLFYIIAMLALGLHIHHGFWSAARTLGVHSAAREKNLKAVATVLAVLLSAGFMVVPIAVLAGLVD
ncbi:MULTISPECIES: succinate dehydrogenase cytochrome b subunit [unclassified Parafrankia]|uniref:succinate dehydrogenase cytochrome b subunit n=1 Tax=unclassified Parafrankia TaxID=2994368 RepID=UPI002729555C|nr:MULTISPECIES: succinate dehydrogenase cytochrome b subunit [unclassified Parafrankia]